MREFVAFLIVGLPGMICLPALDRDESLFAQATVQMLETGDFVSIRYQDHPRDKKPVAMLPLFVSDPKPGSSSKYTVIIPNTVGMVRGCQHKQDAQRLVDFLLSAQTELALAMSKSRQIPLGPLDLQKIPAEVRELAQSVPQGYDLRTLEPARLKCIEWLKSESLR